MHAWQSAAAAAAGVLLNRERTDSAAERIKEHSDGSDLRGQNAGGPAPATPEPPAASPLPPTRGSLAPSDEQNGEVEHAERSPAS